MAETVTKQGTDLTYYDQTIQIERIFDAPIERVFKAYVTASDVEQWWGPARLTTNVEALDAQIGGEWRFTHESPNGDEFAFRGIFHDVVENERLVWTFEFLGAPGHVSLETMEFTDLGGQTKLTATAVFPAPEALAAMQDAGMEEGMLETYERLAALVE